MDDVVRALAREIALLRSEVERQRRRQARMFQPGTVESVDPLTYRARVRLADDQGEPFLSPPRPWSTIAGTQARDWTALEKGQQVMLLSPAGVAGQGLILPFGFSDSVPPPSSSGDERVFGYGDSRLSLDGNGAHLSGQSVTAHGQSVTLTAEEIHTAGNTRLGSPKAALPVLLLGGIPATRVFGI